MPHLNREPGAVDITASAYIVRTDFDEPKIMLHLHRKLDTYLQFGGHKEASENIWGAALHEVRQESGFEPDQLGVLQPPHRIQALPTMAEERLAFHPMPAVNLTHLFIDTRDPELVEHYHNDIAFAFVADEPPRHAPDEGESDDLITLSLAELEQLPNIYENVRAISAFTLQEALLHWEAVPATSFAI